MRTLMTAFLGLVLPTSLMAQSFVNGQFDGTLSGWNVANTANGSGAPGSVSAVDIDGPGPLTAGPAATFMVGVVVYQGGAQAGVEVMQTLHLVGGQAYRVAFDWSVQRIANVPNGQGGVFSLIVDGAVISTQAAGIISASSPLYGHMAATFTPAVTGNQAVGIRITRPFYVAPEIYQYVDNVTVEPIGPAPCYPNCDGSTMTPLLTANDFQCFLSAIAGGSPYANCDGSTLAPVITANDFLCFLSAFGGGCP